MKLQHPWWSEPERNLKWEVRCVDSHGRVASSSVYVNARSEQAAIATGKYWMRVIGIKRRGTVVAKTYRPEHDCELLARGFVRRNTDTQATSAAA